MQVCLWVCQWEIREDECSLLYIELCELLHVVGWKLGSKGIMSVMRSEMAWIGLIESLKRLLMNRNKKK